MEFWHDAILVFLNVFWLLMTYYFYFLASWSYIFVLALLFQKATKRVTFVRSLIREVPASARSRRRARQAEHFSRAGKRSASAMQRLGGFLFPRRPTLRTAWLCPGPAHPPLPLLLHLFDYFDLVCHVVAKCTGILLSSLSTLCLLGLITFFG